MVCQHHRQVASRERDSLSTDHAERDQCLPAFRQGQYTTGLNSGDCSSYPLAKATGEPLLFKADDFSQTDIKRVV
jgi:ribonuclease VapC